MQLLDIKSMEPCKIKLDNVQFNQICLRMGYLKVVINVDCPWIGRFRTSAAVIIPQTEVKTLITKVELDPDLKAIAPSRSASSLGKYPRLRIAHVNSCSSVTN